MNVDIEETWQITEEASVDENHGTSTNINVRSGLCETGTIKKQQETSTAVSDSETPQVDIIDDSLIVSKRTSELSKDPALWVLNDNTRDLIAKHGFDLNGTCDFSKFSKRMYSDIQNRFL